MSINCKATYVAGHPRKPGRMELYVGDQARIALTAGRETMGHERLSVSSVLVIYALKI